MTAKKKAFNAVMYLVNPIATTKKIKKVHRLDIVFIKNLNNSYALNKM